jgi:hypothetical protein
MIALFREPVARIISPVQQAARVVVGRADHICRVTKDAFTPESRACLEWPDMLDRLDTLLGTNRRKRSDA